MPILEFSVSLSIGLIAGAIVTKIIQVGIKNAIDYEYNFKELKEKTENIALSMIRENDKMKAEIKDFYKALEVLTNESKAKIKYLNESNDVCQENKSKD